MTSTFLRIVATACVALGLTTASSNPSLAQNSALSASERSDLKRVSAALNAVHTMEGAFVQIGPEGQMDQGRFYIDKPGRMRFEYEPPAPILLVSDGSTVAVQNKRLNTVDRYPLWTTPLKLILDKDVNLKHNSAIVGVEHQQGSLVIQARSSSMRAQGNITLVFSDPELELRQWTVVDAQGLSTTVALRDMKAGVDLAPSLFVLNDKSKFTKDD